MHYLDEGPHDAPPVLMLHGNPTWSFYYRNLVLALRGRYRCIVPDHLGCGLSDKPGDEHYDYRLKSRTEDIDSLIKHLDLKDPLSLVVHDWGGMIGFAWAVENPDRIARMVVLNTAAFPLPEDKKMPSALSLVRDTALGAFLVRRFNAFSGIAARVAFKQPVSREIRHGYTLPYDSPENRIATLRFVQDIPLTENDPGYDILINTAERLHLLQEKPCLIAWGERDFVFDAPFLNKWIEYFPDAELHRLPDCGHYVLEDGGTELIETISHFFGIREDSDHGHASGKSLEHGRTQ
ncbi:MAG: alpha/beta fold hydrolase [Xanthomonadales bacterium]|nr:alpha/beta fold hydrolase [Gammaproteobacteria bacterium]MBT8054762.1 alpha/beta fold hydrolase [Gammaproteobacteria bacterium]NND58555.1 alpha/beta fold hydrolase [Xanthomonadales bacterium]NNK52249.1 alpha/beta fold hydrolase [Xanthomonadales bacterium]